MYLHQRSFGQWHNDLSLSSPDPVLGSGFGASVALAADGTQLVVGEDFSVSSPHITDRYRQGKVHVYEGDQWALQSTLIPEGGLKPNSFGAKMALSGAGDLLAVCASYDSSDSAAIEPDSGTETLEESGSGYVFSRQGDAWQQQAFIKAPNPDAGDRFCYSLDLSDADDVLVVGAREEDGSAVGVGGEPDSNATDTGAVYLY